MDLLAFDFGKVCRTCGLKADSDSERTSIFADPSAKRILSEEIHELFCMINLNLKKDDGLPQILCAECVRTFSSISSFLDRCKKVQKALGLYVLLNNVKTDKTHAMGSDCNNYVTLEIEQNVKADAQEDGAASTITPLDFVWNCVENELKEENEFYGADIKGDEDSAVNNNDNLNTQSEYVFTEISGDEFDYEEIELKDDDENKPEEVWQCEYFITANNDDEKDSRQSPIDNEELEACTQRKKPKTTRKKYSTETCPFCKRVVARIKQHIPMCPARSVEVCNYCFLAFKTKAELDSHLEKMHSEKLPACHICFCTFEDSLKRNIHMRDFHNKDKFKCTECNIVFKTVHNLSRHNERKHSPVINRECPICKKVLETEFHYNYHLVTHTKEKRYQCKYCGKGFMQPHHKDNHERTHTGEKPFLCDGCGKTYKDVNLLKAHLVKHDRLAFPTKSYLNSGSFPCKICDKVLKTRTTYYAHLRKHRQNTNSQFKCDKCNRCYATKYGLALHPCTQLNENGEKIFPYNCTLCKKGFATPTALARHVQKHQEKRQHVCNQCNASFKRIEHLKGHVKRMHLKLRSYECEECGRKFVQKYELTAHKRVHSDEKPYKCKECPAAFKWKNILNIHERTHTGEKPYGCDVCGASFKLVLSLRTHLTTHSAEEIKEMEKQIFIDFERNRTARSDET